MLGWDLGTIGRILVVYAMWACVQGHQPIHVMPNVHTVNLKPMYIYGSSYARSGIREVHEVVSRTIPVTVTQTRAKDFIIRLPEKGSTARQAWLV
jgi:hypothetical protein